MRCEICGVEPCQTENFCRACREADARHAKLPNSTMPGEHIKGDVGALWDYLNDPDRFPEASQSAWDAVQYALRTHGLAALERQSPLLRNFSEAQIEHLIRSLHRAGVEPHLLQALAELLP